MLGDRLGQAAMQARALGAELQHVAEHRDAAPAGRAPAPPSVASAARIEAGLAL